MARGQNRRSLIGPQPLRGTTDRGRIAGQAPSGAGSSLRPRHRGAGAPAAASCTSGILTRMLALQRRRAGEVLAVVFSVYAFWKASRFI